MTSDTHRDRWQAFWETIHPVDSMAWASGMFLILFSLAETYDVSLHWGVLTVAGALLVSAAILSHTLDERRQA